MHLRKEIKYLVPAAALDEIREAIGSYIEPDPMAGDQGGYEVASTYFDSPEMQAYFQKLEGNDPRIKFRLRNYSGTKVYFLEIKSKIFSGQEKYRLRLKEEDLVCLQNRDFPEYDAAWPLDVFQRFQYYWHRIHLVPSVHIVYQRQPFLSAYHPTLRVTLDTQNRYGRPDPLLITSQNRLRYFLPPHIGILEIKTNLGFPRWIQGLIQNFSLQQMALSKYCLGIQKSYEGYLDGEEIVPCLKY